MKVYTKVQIIEAMSVTGTKPIGVRWVDVNKQTEEDINYRSALLAKDVQEDPKPEFYAATPPLECLRMIVASAVNGLAAKQNYKEPMQIMVCDVGRAYFDVLAVRPGYVQLPKEDRS